MDLNIYVAVFVWGGIINFTSMSRDLDTLTQETISTVKQQGFDPDTDDVRIFNKQGECVWSYDPEN